MKYAVSMLLLALALAGAAWRAGLWQPRESWNPWAPLRIEAEPNMLTRFKLERLGDDPARCLAVLAGSGFRYQGVPDRTPAPGCAIRNAVRVDRSSVALSAPFTLSCPAAVSLALWERHSLLPAAERQFGAAVVRLEHWGSFACRNVYGRDTAPRSRHASAEALDVAAVVLQGGRRIGVAGGWIGDDAAARFWREARDGACPFFDAVLSPDYNAAHADHLHLDRGTYRVCR